MHILQAFIGLLLCRWLQSLEVWKHARNLKQRYMYLQRMKVVDTLPSSQIICLNFTWGLLTLPAKWSCLKMSRWSCLGIMLLLLLSWCLQFLLMQVCKLFRLLVLYRSKYSSRSLQFLFTPLKMDNNIFKMSIIIRELQFVLVAEDKFYKSPCLG